MAKTKRVRKGERVNKSQAIRDAFQKLGLQTRPRDIIAHLKSKRITVSPAQVSNVKGSLNGSSNGRKRPNGEIGVEQLIAAKRLIDATGSIEEAAVALNTLAELR